MRINEVITEEEKVDEIFGTLRKMWDAGKQGYQAGRLGIKGKPASSYFRGTGDASRPGSVGVGGGGVGGSGVTVNVGGGFGPAVSQPATDPAAAAQNAETDAAAKAAAEKKMNDILTSIQHLPPDAIERIRKIAASRAGISEAAPAHYIGDLSSLNVGTTPDANNQNVSQGSQPEPKKRSSRKTKDAQQQEPAKKKGFQDLVGSLGSIASAWTKTKGAYQKGRGATLTLQDLEKSLFKLSPEEAKSILGYVNAIYPAKQIKPRTPRKQQTSPVIKPITSPVVSTTVQHPEPDTSTSTAPSPGSGSVPNQPYGASSRHGFVLHQGGKIPVKNTEKDKEKDKEPESTGTGNVKESVEFYSNFLGRNI